MKRSIREWLNWLDFSSRWAAVRPDNSPPSEEVGDRVIIREVQMGQHLVRNVTAIVNPPASDLLLGQSFLSQFGTVTLDYKRLILVLAP